MQKEGAIVSALTKAGKLRNKSDQHSEAISALQADWQGFDAEGVLSSYQGPALLLSETGAIERANAIAAYNSVLCGLGVIELLADLPLILESHAALTKRITLQQDHERKHVYDITLLPALSISQAEPRILMLARDVSVDANLIEALTHSRSLFKDLAQCTSDFMWEIDSSNRFSYVSPPEALGYEASDLLGCSPEMLAASPAMAEAIQSSFASRRAVQEEEIWIRSAHGKELCLRYSARPVFDLENNLIGARGVGRDVTEEKLKERETQAVRRRDDLIAAIAHATQRATTPVSMLEEAAKELAHALEAHSVWIEDTSQNVAPISWTGGNGAPQEAMVHEFLDLLSGDLSQRPVLVQRYGQVNLVFQTCYNGAVNGRVCMCLPEANDDIIDLIEPVADHLAITLAQGAQLAELNRFSNTDDLTGLLNRRAFYRIGQELILRPDWSGAFLYIDVDNFKALNDTAGHRAGDTLLQKLAAILNRGSSSVAHAVRLGGDEFGVLVEGMDGKQASAFATRILVAFEKVVHNMPEATPQLGLSIGIVEHESNLHIEASLESDGEEALKTLIAQADAALYHVKHGDKGGWHLASKETLSQKISADTKIKITTTAQQSEKEHADANFQGGGVL
ncbi:MAG: diguanylate cyclase (GGDEF)-like protein/PAS domain S-box-containing protein [Parvibaculaceae bacterium]